MNQSFIAQNPISLQIASVNLPLKKEQILLFSTGGLAIALVASVVYSRWQLKQMTKKLRYEQHKIDSIQKRLNLALVTIRKWEENPDLVHSRDCNLDYIRMRMEEPTFHNGLVNQAKVKIKQFISTALRINLSQNKPIGIASKSGCKIDETFDITYQTDVEGKSTRRVLFRIQVKLMKLPAQSTSATIGQIIECIEGFLSPAGVSDNWQPTVQGHIVSMSWNQKAKPTPLLLLEQHSQGVNVSFRTKPNQRK